MNALTHTHTQAHTVTYTDTHKHTHRQAHYCTDILHLTNRDTETDEKMS